MAEGRGTLLDIRSKTERLSQNERAARRGASEQGQDTEEVTRCGENARLTLNTVVVSVVSLAPFRGQP